MTNLSSLFSRVRSMSWPGIDPLATRFSSIDFALGAAGVAMVANLAIGVGPAALAGNFGTVVLVSGFCLLPLAAALYFLRRAAFEMKKIAGVCERTSKGDFEARILHIHEGGDLGAVEHNINHLLDVTDAFVRESGASMQYVSEGKYFRQLMVRGLPGAFRNSANVINAASDAMKKKVDDFNRFAADVGASVSAVVDLLGQSASDLKTNAEILTQTADESTNKSNTVAAASEEATTNVQSVAAASEQLSSSISEIGRQAQESSAVASEAVEQASRTNEVVTELSETAGKIGEVVEMINDIAAQTNLLALNATIEAARAGEAGRGFAVVATEVKSLAGQTGNATETVSRYIEGMQSATGNAVAAIEQIVSTIERVSNIATAIASAVHQQAAATQEIAQNVQQAAAGTRDVTENVAGISKAAGETGQVAGQVLESSNHLASHADDLRKEVNKLLAGINAA